MDIVLIIIGLTFLVVFGISCIITFFVFRQIKKQMKKIEELNAEEEEKFERRVKEQHETMEEFRKKNFPNY